MARRAPVTPSNVALARAAAAPAPHVHLAALLDQSGPHQIPNHPLVELVRFGPYSYKYINHLHPRGPDTRLTLGCLAGGQHPTLTRPQIPEDTNADCHL